VGTVSKPIPFRNFITCNCK